MYAQTFIFVLFAAVLGQNELPNLPEELANLSALAAQESKLLDAVRNYDKEQSALVDADVKDLQELKAAGKTAEIEAKQQDALKRCKNIRLAYEFALKRYPGNPRIKTYYGELLYDRFGELDKAVKHWEESIILDPKLSLPYNDLGIHYCHTGNYTKGIPYYDRALELEPDNPDYLFNLVQTYLVNYPEVQKCRKWKKPKVYKEAMKLSKKATTLASDDFELAQDYALNFFTAENFDARANWKDAAEAWQRARTLARNDAERMNAWVNEGRVWIKIQDTAKARACLEEALKIQPESAVVKNLLGNLNSGDAGSDTKPSRTNVNQPGKK